MRNIFTEHPNSMGETYLEHFKFAAYFGINMLIGGLACLIHAILPFLFKKTGSDILIRTFQQFVERMPVAEDRFVVVSETINRKKAANE